MRIMVLNQTPQNTRDPRGHENVLRMLRSYASPGTEVDLHFPDDVEGAGVMSRVSAQGIHSSMPYDMITGAFIRKAVWAEQNGYDAIIQNNDFDPAVEVTRLAVSIPMLSMCRTAVHIAATLSDRIGITAPFPGYALTTRRLLKTYGLESFVTDVRSFGLKTFAISDEELLERAVKVLRGLVEETGAECLLPLGGGAIPYRISPTDVEREVGVPVLNSKAIAIRWAEMCVGLGLSHSPITYPKAKLNADDFASYAYR